MKISARLSALFGIAILAFPSTALASSGAFTSVFTTPAFSRVHAAGSATVTWGDCCGQLALAVSPKTVVMRHHKAYFDRCRSKLPSDRAVWNTTSLREWEGEAYYGIARGDPPISIIWRSPQETQADVPMAFNVSAHLPYGGQGPCLYLLALSSYSIPTTSCPAYLNPDLCSKETVYASRTLARHQIGLP